MSRYEACSSILMYSIARQEANQVLYDGFIEELVQVLHIDDSTLTDTKCSIMKSLTAIISVESRTKSSLNSQKLIDAIQSDGLLSTLVRQSVDQLIDNNNNNQRDSQSLSGALFSFIYHLSSHKEYIHILLNSDIIQSFIRVINSYDQSQHFLTFVIRSVRIIDLITTSNMTLFHSNNVLLEISNRFKYEITQCQKDIIDRCKDHQSTTTRVNLSDQRLTLLKSILNYFKKVLIESSMIDLINSLKDIINSIDYYGLSLFHLIIDILVLCIFQQPSQLLFFQKNGLIDILMKRLFEKDRLLIEEDIFIFLPNLCSALCLNTIGLQHFMSFQPFDRLIQILLTSKHLQIRKRKNRFENIFEKTMIDETKKDEINLRQQGMKSIILLLKQLVPLINNDQEDYSLTTLFLLFNYSIFNENKQSIDLFFQLFSLISQHFRNYNEHNIFLFSSTISTSLIQMTNINCQLSLFDNKIVFDSQFDLILQTLTPRLCTENGLQFAIQFLLNISNNNQIIRQTIRYKLLNHICLLANNLNEDLKHFHCDIEDYLSKKKSIDPQSLKTFRLYERVPNNTHDQSMKINSNIKQHLQFPSLNLLTSKNGNQQFFVRILKLILELDKTIEKDSIHVNTFHSSNNLFHSFDIHSKQIHTNSIDDFIEQIKFFTNKCDPILFSTKILNENPLWNTLNDCLLSLSKLSNSNTSLILQPIVEIFFVILPFDIQNLIEFLRRHSTILNEIISYQYFLQIRSHFFISCSTRFDFNLKKEYFHYELNRLKETNINEEDFYVHLRYNYQLEDLYKVFHQYSFNDWKKTFHIRFNEIENEIIFIDWYSMIIHFIFDSNSGLFLQSSFDHHRYVPNLLSIGQKNHFQYLKFAGQIIGKCLFDDQHMNYYFIRSFYKSILGISIDYPDMEYYKNNLEQFDFDCQEKVLGCMKEQINAFVEGFYEIIPKYLLALFNEQELELLISGQLIEPLDHADIEHAKTNT